MMEWKKSSVAAVLVIIGERRRLTCRGRRVSHAAHPHDRAVSARRLDRSDRARIREWLADKLACRT